MTKHISLATMVALGALSVTSLAARAADDVELAPAGSAFSLAAGIGWTWLEGNELVYDDVGNRISHLIWETNAPVVTLAAKGEVMNNWTVSASGAVAFSGNSHMEDYDWLDAAPSYEFDDWSDQSIHPDTRLDHYFTVDVALGRNFVLNPAATINLHAGFKYTDVKWTAYGGSYIYSDAGFRDDIGNFPDGERGISFQQRYPGFFVGAEATATSGAFTFTGLFRGGLTINASDTDHHWMRDLRFEDSYGIIPFVSASAKVDYQATDRISLFASAGLDKYFRTKGDTDMYDIPTGDFIDGTFVDGAGMDFMAITLQAGARFRF